MAPVSLGFVLRRASESAMALPISSKNRFSVSGAGFILGRRRKEFVPETSSLSSAPLRYISRNTMVCAR